LTLSRAGKSYFATTHNSMGKKPISFHRHPLQEQTVDTFVPNDILVVGGAGIGSCPAAHVEADDHVSDGSIVGNSVVICTGANACGKV
jgi:DNA mismatch repair ATPase MutS